MAFLFDAETAADKLHFPDDACSHSCAKHCPRDVRPNFAVPAALSSLGICEWLEDNPRLVFIVDLDNGQDSGMLPTFCNAALRARHGLLDLVFNPKRLDTRRHPAASKFADFRTWASTMTIESQVYIVHNIRWTSYTVKARWKCISGDDISTLAASTDMELRSSLRRPAPSPLASSERVTKLQRTETDPVSGNVGASVEARAATDILPVNDYNLWTKSKTSSAAPRLVHHSLAGFDCTRFPPQIPSKHINLVRDFDWSTTPLGPISQWPFSLRQMCNLVLLDVDPAVIYCGPELLMIYNEPWIVLAGQLHPEILGQGVHKPFAGVWDYYVDLFRKVWDTGQVVREEASAVFLERQGFTEECYIDLTCSPVLGEDGSIVGILSRVPESTKRIISDRRMSTLLRLSERTARARDLKHFWSLTLDALQDNEPDVPFALLFSVHEPTDGTKSKHCTLEGSLGIPDGHPAGLRHLDLDSATPGYAPILKGLLKTRTPTLYESLPDLLTEGIKQRGFGDVCKSAIICPLFPTSSDDVLGFLVLGLNTRRPYDHDYQFFIQLLSRQLTTALASVVLFEEEKRSGRTAAEQAALDQKLLAAELQTQTEQVRRSEMRWTRFAEQAPMGISILRPDGRVMFSNRKMLELSGLPTYDTTTPMGWLDSILEEDVPEVKSAWARLTDNKKPATFELRMKTKWQPPTSPDAEEMNMWLLFLIYPDILPDGTVEAFVCVATSINQQKWAEKMQHERLKDALETKRQQENFIDMTSHEMRNPLSAIIQCTDEIVAAFKALQGKIDPELDCILGSGMEAAETIAYCGQHQKRIINDILTLSKLDSNLLNVTPVLAEPIAVAHEALKIFEPEFRAEQIEARLEQGQDFKDLGVTSTLFDPSRVIQVLVNLIANALKFTKLGRKRCITVKLDASVDRPRSEENGVTALLEHKAEQDVTSSPEWGNGERVFLHFSVEDTGKGMTPQETKNLFMRFRQANPRTHIDYGGSGLGLFISRNIVHLHGGEITVASTPGIGSTFSFYIVARRTYNTVSAPSTPPPGAEAIKFSTGRTRTASPLRTTTIAPTATGPVSILVVEDNLVNQKIAARQLRAQGFIVYTANHGLEALDFLKTTRFWHGEGQQQQTSPVALSAVLMDIEMPILNGIDCTRQIRRLESDGLIAGHIPIIAVTANARDEQIHGYLAGGFDDVVSKPFRIQELVPRIEVLLRRAEEGDLVVQRVTPPG